jgi:hypothetical protein
MVLSTKTPFPDDNCFSDIANEVWIKIYVKTELNKGDV